MHTMTYLSPEYEAMRTPENNWAAIVARANYYSISRCLLVTGFLGFPILPFDNPFESVGRASSAGQRSPMCPGRTQKGIGGSDGTRTRDLLRDRQAF
jgi:hypothetical protein